MHCFEIPNNLEHRIILVDSAEKPVTLEMLRESLKYLFEECVKCNKQNRSMQLFVFFGGHGVSHEQTQVALLNQSEANQALFMIEKELIQLANDLRSLRTISFYDSSNIPITNYKALREAVGLK